MSLTRLPFARNTYTGPGPFSAQRLCNMYAETLPDDASQPFVVRSAPGLVATYTVGPGPIRAMNADLPGRVYIVSGNELWRMPPDQDEAPSFLGFVGATGMATIAVGPVNGCVCTGPDAYAFNHAGTEFRQISGDDWQGASSVTYLDGYFVFTSIEATSQFFVSALFDAEAVDPLDFAYSDGVPNVVRRGITHNRQLWLAGEGALEVWYNSGDSDFPFRPVSGGVLTPGTVSPRSVATIDNSVWWLGKDGVVYRSQGYQAVRVSTFAIERIIKPYQLSNDNITVAFKHEGHTFVAITLDIATLTPRTIVYDCATQLWHERASSSDGTNRWRVSAAGERDRFLLGDSETAHLHVLDSEAPSDNGIPLYREATLPTLTAHGPRCFMPRLEVEAELATLHTPGSLLMDYSDDGGQTFGPLRTATTSQKRATFNRLGSYRQRVIRLRATGLLTLYGATAEIETGDN